MIYSKLPKSIVFWFPSRENAFGTPRVSDNNRNQDAKRGNEINEIKSGRKASALHSHAKRGNEINEIDRINEITWVFFI
ncbi:hypothetical protein [Desulfonema magnum]|uniref:hypothetical protein n=1 Tax=Desulfonema magnum TaxID=45655 RepID=UPI001A9BE260|nr:hypothetical protein [Desulfonema magnum]